MRVAALLLSCFAATASAFETLHLLQPHELVMNGDEVASDSGAAPNLEHYGRPPDGCDSDEKAFQIQGVPGMVCAPTCDAAGGCPSDIPAGVTARPQCALQNGATGDKYCVLICHEEMHSNLRIGDVVGDAQCGDGDCQIVQAGLGICTYGQ